MGYRLVQGEFHLFYQGERHVGAQPDGDSIWFKPRRAANLHNLAGRSAELNAGGFAQLRFEGIDTLELHYKGAEQNRTFAEAARNLTLRTLGFGNVTYANSNSGLSVRDAAPHPVLGHILTRAIDPFGRPVSFVFAGASPKADGSEVWLDAAMFRRSVNAKVAANGQAYPGFYTGLPVDIRAVITSHVVNAFNRGAGVWANGADVSTTGFSVTRLAQLEELVIWPKLFRRLTSFFGGSASKSLNRFDEWVREDAERDDALWIISRGEAGNMHDVVEVKQGRMRMRYEPEDLVIVPR